MSILTHVLTDCKRSNFTPNHAQCKMAVQSKPGLGRYFPQGISDSIEKMTKMAGNIELKCLHDLVSLHYYGEHTGITLSLFDLDHFSSSKTERICVYCRPSSPRCRDWAGKKVPNV